MKKFKKLSVLAFAMTSMLLSACTANQAIENTEKAEKAETVAVIDPKENKDTAKKEDENQAKADEEKKADADKKEENKENKEEVKEDKKEEASQVSKEEAKPLEEANQLTDSEKMEIDSLINRMDRMANGSAGSSLAVDELFADLVSAGAFIETKYDAVKDYAKEKTTSLGDPENFKLTLKALESTSDLYKQDKKTYVNEILPDSGATWDPQINISTFDNLIDALK